MTASPGFGTEEACCCALIPLCQVSQPRGTVCVAEIGEQVPFAIERVYWIFDVPAGVERAHHAHREQQELLVAVRGRFTVHCDNGATLSTHTLDSADTALLLPPMVFHHLDEFSPGAICLVLASGPYDPSELVSDYAEFRELIADR